MNQIKPYYTGMMQTSAIKSADLTKHIDEIINKGYSYSTVKKTYELLNQYFTFLYLKQPNNNPMLPLHKPTQKSMNYTPKEIAYFLDDDIDKFEEAALGGFSFLIG